MPDQDKVPFDVSAREELGNSLTKLFVSQIAGGKRYDLATIGRRRANATYFESHGVDTTSQLIFAMDLSPLAKDDKIDLVDYTVAYIDKFRNDVKTRLSARLGRKS